MFDACTTDDTAHIDTIFQLFPTRVTMVTRMWQQLEYRIDVCRVTRGEHIEHLYLSKKKTFSVFLWL